jgi:hypothetical protein
MDHTLKACLALTSLVAGCLGPPAASTASGTAVASNAGHYSVVLDSSSVPLHRGVNDVVLHVSTRDGSPARLLTVHAMMPEHGHEAFPTEITNPSAGTFVATGLTLTMAGEWQLDLGLSHDGTTEDDSATLWAAVE